MALKTSDELRARLALFPLSTRLEEETLTVSGWSLQELAEQYKTPLYIYDQATLENALEDYRFALRTHYPGESGIVYAGKAFLCLALAQWSAKHGLLLDCSSAGEIAIAVAAGVPRSQVLLHGVGKDRDDFSAALKHAALLVADHLGEVERFIALLQETQPPQAPALWLRLRPDLTVSTHPYTQTGQSDSKFGMGSEEWLQALQTALQAGLTVEGIHFHLGSQFRDPSPLIPAASLALDVVAEAQRRWDWLPRSFCAGGGWGMPYHEDDLPYPLVEEYVRQLSTAVAEGCRDRHLPLPNLYIEPGRSLIARSGVALYRVSAVKASASRRWIILDGGLADNPRPALYGARYTALPVTRPFRPPMGVAWLAGPYCESGDVLIEALPMPEVQLGEVLAVPMSGAYHLSMASNYNGARRPAVLWLQPGQVKVVRQRESLHDLYRLDLPLE